MLARLRAEHLVMGALWLWFTSTMGVAIAALLIGVGFYCGGLLLELRGKAHQRSTAD